MLKAEIKTVRELYELLKTMNPDEAVAVSLYTPQEIRESMEKLVGKKNQSEFTAMSDAEVVGKFNAAYKEEEEGAFFRAYVNGGYKTGAGIEVAREGESEDENHQPSNCEGLKVYDVEHVVTESTSRLIVARSEDEAIGKMRDMVLKGRLRRDV